MRELLRLMVRETKLWDGVTLTRSWRQSCLDGCMITGDLLLFFSGFLFLVVEGTDPRTRGPRGVSQKAREPESEGEREGILAGLWNGVLPVVKDAQRVFRSAEEDRRRQRLQCTPYKSPSHRIWRFVAQSTCTGRAVVGGGQEVGKERQTPEVRGCERNGDFQV
ncbi:hypothetical protein F4802DRAFT_23664 [Xylaria palmicola]|nr:hypothetical protein F4802DRAFT_23664 [Xylaria palmicola]